MQQRLATEVVDAQEQFCYAHEMALDTQLQQPDSRHIACAKAGGRTRRVLSKGPPEACKAGAGGRRGRSSRFAIDQVLGWRSAQSRICPHSYPRGTPVPPLNMKALSRRAARHVIAAVLLLSAGRSAAQLQIAVSTPSPSTDPSQPNSYIGLTSSQYAVSLLGDGLPAFVWGSVPSSSVGDVCNTIVDTGSHSIDTVISGDNWGNSPTSYEMTFQVRPGCLRTAAQDDPGVLT